MDTTLRQEEAGFLNNATKPNDNAVFSLSDVDEVYLNKKWGESVQQYTPEGLIFNPNDVQTPLKEENKKGIIGNFIAGVGRSFSDGTIQSGVESFLNRGKYYFGMISGEEFLSNAEKTNEERQINYSRYLVENPNVDTTSKSFNIGSSASSVGAPIVTRVVFRKSFPGLLFTALNVATSKTIQYDDKMLERAGLGIMPTKDQLEHDAYYTALSTGISTGLEYIPLVNFTKYGDNVLKRVVKNTASQSVEEGLDQALDIGLDFVGGYADLKKMPVEYVADVVQAIESGGFYSFAISVTDAVFYKRRAKSKLREHLRGTVSKEMLDTVVDDVYNGTIKTLQDLVSANLKTNKELQEKHGDIMNRLSNQIAKQIADAGAYTDMTESQKAVFIRNEASRFADKVLIESNLRGIPMEDIVNASDIVYENGELYLRGTNFKAPSSKVKVKPNATAEKDKVEYTPVGVSAPVMDEVVEIDGYDTVRLSGKNVPITYEIVEADTLLTSHSYLGTENPDYPKHLQNRNRGRKELVDQVTQMSANLDPALLGKSVTGTDGAPIITQDGNVAIGNGRANAIIRAYDTGNEEEYRNALAKDYDVSSFERPVLVRRFVDNYSAGTMRKLIEDANTPLTAGFSNSEQALTDAGRLTDNTLSLLNPDYEIDTATNRDFVNLAFNEIIPQSERGRYLDDSGYITEDGMKRIKASTLAKIVSDEKLLSSILESNDETIRKASQGVMEVSAKINMLESLIKKGQVKPEYSIKNDIQKAFKKYVEAKRSKQDTEVFLNNKDLFETDLTPAQQKVLDIFMKSRNSGEVKNRLARYVQSAVNEGDSTQARMFGEPLTKEQILDFDKLHQEQIELAETMLALDRVSPEYKGETININGVERSVYNSEGNRIAKSEKALRAFYKWFGNSKVVDEQGRPLVVYHGTNAKFDTFRKMKGKVYNFLSEIEVERQGFFFTDNRDVAQNIGKIVMPVYLKSTNVFDLDSNYHSNFMKGFYKQLQDSQAEYLEYGTSEAWEFFDGETGKAFIKYLQENGYDGATFEETPYEDAETIKTNVVFSPNQIKSVDNRGTFDLNDANIYHQEQITELEMDVANDMRKRLGVEGAIYELEYTKRLFDRNLHNEHPTVVEMTKKRIASLDRQIEWLRGGNQLTVTQKPVDQSMNVKAREHFGTTTNINEAGYIMQDGSMLDFSGKKFGGQAGRRTMDHREVASAFEDEGFNVEMTDFIDNGNIRFIPESKTFLMSRMPTPQQIEQIQKISDRVNGEVIIECVEQAKEWGSDYGFYNEYDKGTGFKTIKRDITSFFKTGKVSDTNKFLQATYVDEPTFNPDKYFERKDVKIEIQKSKDNFAKAIDEIESGSSLSKTKPIVLFKPTEIWLRVGLPNRKISFDQSKIRKVMREHNLTSDDLKRLPEQLANPEYIFESKTDNEAYVGVLTKDKEPFVAVVKTVGTGLKITNIIKSAYNKDSGFVNREIKAGRLLYDKKNPKGIRRHRASIAQVFIPSDNSNISQSETDVKYEQAVYEDNDFYAIHNIDRAGLTSALKLGGFAMPSFAVKRIGLEAGNQFGEITLVGNKRLATPSRSVEVYDRDAWSPTIMNALRYDLSEKGVEFIKDVLKRNNKERSYSSFWYNITDSLKHPSSNTMAMELYALDKGLSEDEATASKLWNNEDYLNWYEKNIFENAEPYLFTENDAETDMIRRKFTLPNIMKYLRKQENYAGGYIGNFANVNSLLMYFSNKFPSLKEMKAKKRNITTRKEQAEHINNLNDEYYDISEKIKKDDRDYKFYESSQALAFALVSEKGVKQSLERDKMKTDDETVRMVESFKEKLRDVATDYFEAKPRRIVGVDEFSGAILPNTKEYDVLAQQLSEKGLSVKRIEKGNLEQQQKALEEINLERPDVYFQDSKKPRQRKVVKGSFDAFKKSIGITKDADASTYSHEFSHFWVDSIWEHIESGNATEEYIKRFEGVMKYIGAERGKKLTREQHEKFARAYEKFLFTAEVPKGVNPDVFDEYETFIRDVYDDITQIDTRAGEEYEPITEEVYNFFNSMTRDPLPKPRYLAEDVEFMKRQEEQLDKDVEEVQTERNKVIEARANIDEQDNVVSEELKKLGEKVGVVAGQGGTYTMQPVQTDNKTGFLTAYKKTTGQELEAGAMEQEAELKRATEFVNNNPELAEQIVMGNVPHPAGYSKNAIYIAYNELQKKLGNTDKRADSLINQALELRAMGQEISIQRLVYGVDPAQFINAIVNERTDKVAKRNGIKTRKELSDKIKEGVKKGLNEGKTPDQVVDEMARGLALKPKPKSEKEPDTSIYGYKKALKYVEERLGVGMSKDEAVNIIRIVDDMNRNLENAKSKNQNPTIEYFVKLKELEDYVNTLAPSSDLRVLVSVIGKANLLASVKSPVTNVVANIPTNLIMAGTRRIRLGVMNSIVDSELTKRAKKEAWDIYKKTGFYIFSMDDPRRGTKQILSEDITNTSGSGVVKAYGRFMENLIFHWSMGAPDVMFKNFTFVDYASLKATKLANGDKARANELFEDACRIVPLTKEGKEIRNEAIQESLVATYQNNSWLSERALKVRGSLDFGVGFGEIISPFVKTPANVIGTGLRYSFGGVKAIASEVVRGVQRGGFKLSDVTPENRSLLMDNTIGFLVSLALASLFDDEDYMPPYVLATTKERQLAKELNIAYNSIRIGDTWYSLDYFGVLASPLVSILQARRSEGIAGSVAGFVKGGGVQALSIPGFANVSEVWENIENTLRKEPEKAYSDIAGDFVDGVYNRAVPMIVSDIARAVDDYEREAKTTGERIQSKIPVFREDLPEKVSLTTGQPEEMGNAFLDIVAGSRVKPQLINDVADEFKRLSDAGYGVQLTDVTQRGALSELEEEDKQSVREDFAKEYSRLVGNLIRGATYRRATDEEKSEMINKIRSKITKQLRNKYKNRRVK